MINNDKQMITSYKSVLLLPICEKVIFSSSFVNTNNDNLRNSNQSRLRPGDLFVHQLISITHEIYKAFDVNQLLELSGVLLDLS